MTEPMPMPPPETGTDATSKRAKSNGEKLFDRITYVGIAGIGTFVVTVPLAFELEHHPLIKPYFDKAVARTESVLTKLSFGKPHATASEAVKTTTLMQGGNLMLLPVGLMEYFKIPIVRGFNAAIKDPTPESQIEKAPKQTLSSLVKSRVVAWCVVFGSLTAMRKAFQGTLETFEKEFGRHTVKFTNCFRTQPNKVSLMATAMEGTRPYAYGKIAALDVFATAASATLLYLGGHFFARKQEEKKELREERKHETLTAKIRSSELRESAPGSLPESPSSSLSGERAHEGTAHTPSMAQQV